MTPEERLKKQFADAMQKQMVDEVIRACGIDPGYSTSTAYSTTVDPAATPLKPKPDFDSMKRLNVIRVISTTVRGRVSLGS